MAVQNAFVVTDVDNSVILTVRREEGVDEPDTIDLIDDRGTVITIPADRAAEVADALSRI